MALFVHLVQSGCWSDKKKSLWKSAIFHSIKLPFDAEVDEKFLNVIYYTYTHAYLYDFVYSIYAYDMLILILIYDHDANDIIDLTCSIAAMS